MNFINESKFDCLSKSISETHSDKSKPSSLMHCLGNIENDFKKNQKIITLWKEWPKIAGPELSNHCTPLSIFNGILIVGANHPQWIQALIFNRNQLIASLKANGHLIKDLKIKNFVNELQKTKQAEKEIWRNHPSRIDMHGITKCNICKKPAPAGEIILWGKCGLCRRKDLGPNKT